MKLSYLFCFVSVLSKNSYFYSVMISWTVFVTSFILSFLFWVCKLTVFGTVNYLVLFITINGFLRPMPEFISCGERTPLLKLDIYFLSCWFYSCFLFSRYENNSGSRILRSICLFFFIGLSSLSIKLNFIIWL